MKTERRKTMSRDAKTIMRLVINFSLVLIVSLLVPGSGYSQFQPGQKRIVGDGQELSVKGVIMRRDADGILLRDLSRTDTLVMLTDGT